MSIPWINFGGSRGVGKTTVAQFLASRYDQDEVIWLDRVSNRPIRPGEERTQEYQFPETKGSRLELGSIESSADELIGFNTYSPFDPDFQTPTIRDGQLTYSRPVKRGKRFLSKDRIGGDSLPDLLPASIEMLYIDGNTYISGVLHPKYWPQPTSRTKLVISIFGRSSPKMKKYVKEYAPEHVPEMTNFFLRLKTRELKKRLGNRNQKLGLSFDSRLWGETIRYLRTHPENDFDHVVYNDGTPEECALKIARIAGISLPAKVLR